MKDYTQFHSEWIEKYNNGIGTSRISKDYGCCNKTVARVIRRVRDIRSIGDSRYMATINKYAEYDGYFDVIDTEEKVYFLGLILADGSIMKNKSARQQTMCLGLQIEDRKVVDRLSVILGRKVYCKLAKGRRKSLISVSVCSDHICNVLKGYGFTERKSTDNHDAIGFKYIPLDLVRHFIRGIIDGDGCICIRKDGVSSIKVVGNQQDMATLANILGSIGCAKRLPRKDKRNNVYEVEWGSQTDLIRIIHYLYDNATIYLHRKKAKADKILEMYNNKIK